MQKISCFRWKLAEKSFSKVDNFMIYFTANEVDQWSWQLYDLFYTQCYNFAIVHWETIGDGEFNSYLGDAHTDTIFPKILLGLPSLTRTQKKVAVSLFVCYGLFFCGFLLLLVFCFFICLLLPGCCGPLFWGPAFSPLLLSPFIHPLPCQLKVLLW